MSLGVVQGAAPAQMLGLTNKGHLGEGADADITLYAFDHDKEQMFQLPRHVLKGGEFVIRDGELIAESSGGEAVFGETLTVSPDFDRDAERHIEHWFNEHYSLRLRNYALID